MCRSKAQGGRRCPNRGGMNVGAFGGKASVVAEPIKEELTLNPATPKFNQLMTSNADEWFNTSWQERREITTLAVKEILALSGSTATFKGWSRSKATMGKAVYSRNLYTNEVKVQMELSELNGRTAEPRTLANTIAHEVAHTLCSIYEGHGSEWLETYKGLKEQVGLETEHTHTHKETAHELAERKKLTAEKKSKAPWVGTCPQGHDFTAGRKPKYGHICVKCDRAGKSADITYVRRNNK